MLAKLDVWQNQAIVDVLQNYQSNLHYVSILLLFGVAYLFVKDDQTRLRILGYLAGGFAVISIISQYFLYAETLNKLVSDVPESGSVFLTGVFPNRDYLGTFVFMSMVSNVISLVFLTLFAALGKRR
jgi:hypothetical protein